METTIQELKEKGIINKYVISKVDGSPVDENAEHFVLRLDAGGSDPKHIEACRKAIVAYARAIKNHLPKLSEEILLKYDPNGWKPYRER